MPNVAAEIARQLVNRYTGWNMGSFGAIAEFHHVADDPMPRHNSSLVQITARGAVRVDDLTDVRPIAFETLSTQPLRWTHGVALCLPRHTASMHVRQVLTELGPDRNAIRQQDQHAVLFDLGLGQHQVDFCVRTADPYLLKILRENANRCVFDDNNPTMSAILRTHPHRVALTRIGRVEVYQLIGGPATNGKPPLGPHTHVLPKLLSTGRTHAANIPVPDGWTPCAMYHPKNPVIGQLGENIAFDNDAFQAFQLVLSAWGDKDYVIIKHAVWNALENGVPPALGPQPANRLGRVAVRNALRQWIQQGHSKDVVGEWTRVYDRRGDDCSPENPGH